MRYFIALVMVLFINSANAQTETIPEVPDNVPVREQVEEPVSPDNDQNGDLNNNTQNSNNNNRSTTNIGAGVEKSRL